MRWAKRPGAAEELVAIGWWEDRGDHYQIVQPAGGGSDAAYRLHHEGLTWSNRKTTDGRLATEDMGGGCHYRAPTATHRPDTQGHRERWRPDAPRPAPDNAPTASTPNANATPSNTHPNPAVLLRGIGRHQMTPRSRSPMISAVV